MKQVTVYEISKEHREVIGSYVEVAEREGFDLQTPFCNAGGKDQFLFHREVVKYHELPVQTLRQSNGADVYLAIGPELKKILLKSLEAENEERLDYQKRQLEMERRIVENLKSNWEDAVLHADSCITEFNNLPLYLRIWKAIKKEI